LYAFVEKLDGLECAIRGSKWQRNARRRYKVYPKVVAGLPGVRLGTGGL